MSSEWTQTTLGDVCIKITDGAHASPKTVVTGKPMASVKDLTRFGVDLSSARLISVEDFENLVKQGCRPEVGDVLIAKDGNSALDTVCSVSSLLDAVLLSSVAILRPDPAKIDTDFLKFYLSSTDVIDYLKSTFISGAAIPRVVLRDFKKAEISIPPITSQRNITSVLNALENRIFLLRETNATLEAIAQALFKSWFVDFDPVRAKMEGRAPEGMDEATAALFPDALEESELGWVPKGWRVAKVYEVSQVIYGAPFASKLFKAERPGRPLVRIRDLKDERPGVYTEEAHPKGYLLKPGDIAVGMDGEFRAYLWGGEEAWLNQRVCVFQPINNASAAFVRCSIAPLLAAVEASETATTVIHLGKNDIDRFKVVVPAPGILAAFAAVTVPLYSRLVVGKQQAQTLATLRDTLLPRLISGQLRLTEAKEQLEDATA